MADYSIWVMEYAYIPEVPISSVIYGAHNQGVRKLPYGYVLIKGQGVIAMVDVGYNHSDYGQVLGEKFGAQAWQVIYPFFDPAYDADPSWEEARAYHRGAITNPVPNNDKTSMV